MKWQNKNIDKIIEHNKLSSIIVSLFSFNLPRIESILVLTDFLKRKANSLLFVKCAMEQYFSSLQRLRGVQDSEEERPRNWSKDSCLLPKVCVAWSLYPSCENLLKHSLTYPSKPHAYDCDRIYLNTLLLPHSLWSSAPDI